MAKDHGTDPNKTNQKSVKFFVKFLIMLDFISEVVVKILLNMNDDELQYHILQKGHIKKQLRQMLKVDNAFLREKEEWRKFYQKHFSLDFNFSQVVIPRRPADGKWRLLIIAEGLSLNQVYDSMSKQFKCWKYFHDLNASVTKNARNTMQSYAVWVRDSRDFDEKYSGKSTNQADPGMTIGITLLERMIYEMVYFDETRKHLDLSSVTFCSGSRCAGGKIPVMGSSSYVHNPVKVHLLSCVEFSNTSGIREVIAA